MRHFRLRILLATIAVGSFYLIFPSETVASAMSVLQHVSTRLSQASNVDYTSTVQMTDSSGHSKKYFVHAVLQKPCSLKFQFSQTALNDPKSSFVVNNNTAVYEYDGVSNKFKLYQPQHSHFHLDRDLVGAKPLMTMLAETLKDQPLLTLFPNDPDNPLVLSSRGSDIPGATTVTASQSQTGSSESLVRLVVPPGDYVPRRLQVSVLQDGVETVLYREDFTSFTIDGTVPDSAFTPTMPKDAVPWTDEELAQSADAPAKAAVDIHPGVRGLPAPVFTVPSITPGGTWAMPLHMGKPFLIYFFDQNSTANFEDVQSAMRRGIGQNFLDTVFIDTGDSRETEAQIPGTSKYTMSLQNDVQGEVTRMYGVTTLPAVFLINRNETIVDSWAGGSTDDTATRIGKDLGLLGF